MQSGSVRTILGPIRAVKGTPSWEFNSSNPDCHKLRGHRERTSRPIGFESHAAPRVAQCTNRHGSPKVAEFRIFHLMEPERSTAETRTPGRLPRPTRADAAPRAAAWRAELAIGAVSSRAALARREALSRARITQILAIHGAQPRMPSPSRSAHQLGHEHAVG